MRRVHACVVDGGGCAGSRDGGGDGGRKRGGGDSATGVGSALLAKADGMEGVDWAAKTEVGVRAVARAAEVTGVATEAAKEV
jgi:hypothetical protein